MSFPKLKGKCSRLVRKIYPLILFQNFSALEAVFPLQTALLQGIFTPPVDIGPALAYL
jgi:hypothetical protein